VSVTVRVDREGDRGRLVPSGPFDLAHAAAVARVVEHAPPGLEECRSIDVDLGDLDRIDGAGAVLLAAFLDRLDADGGRTSVVENGNSDAARLIALYRARRGDRPAPPARRRNILTRIGAAAAALPRVVTSALDFTGRCAVAVPKAVVTPRSVDWRSLPRLLQEIGADGLVVTSAANLLVGLIIGLLGISQLARFGAVVYVPELVVVAQFRELGPLVTAIVVAGRSGAGLASELATMKVSEEIDALRAMGFDPVRWLVVPRCAALVAVVPLLTLVGNVLALLGGFVAAAAITDMPPRAYVLGTIDAITAANLLGGLVKTPFLALAIGLIACGQGLAAQGGAAAVGARTTSAVVLSILGVIVLNALFTFLYAFMGI
jgi:phospholipid/cholesterol/gamma-HCH transport system permease protein